MRKDALGLFWMDLPVVKEKKPPKPKRTPPEPVWLKDDYLPNLEEARRFDVPIIGDQNLARYSAAREPFVVDVEVYSNYFLAAFANIRTGGVTYVEMFEGAPLDTRKLHWLMSNLTTLSFNGINYDLPMITLAVAGYGTEHIKFYSDKIIVEGWRPYDVLKQARCKKPDYDHIDLIEVCPLRASLKIYGGRLHTKKMQDLPFPPEKHLSEPQAAITRYYCVNDLRNTILLSNCLSQQIALRTKMSVEYNTDLRSKSDAQIAETVISREIEKRTGHRCTRPTIAPGTAYRYKVPAFIRYHTPKMNWALDIIRKANFVVGESGAVEMPAELKLLKLEIANAKYQMGIGGLHSTESTVSYKESETHIIRDRDVVSYYPMIILSLGLFPEHLGQIFLNVYQSLVTRRVNAKKSGLKAVAETLKIVVNGSFGKFGSKHSILYGPDLLIQTTVTGQLSLLMLIERMELSGITVISANTDGIVLYCPREKQDLMNSIVAQWEKDTNFETEETEYIAYYGRDVNNYIAVKPDLTTKSKGALFNPWRTIAKSEADKLTKNPSFQICNDAVEDYLTHKIPVQQTILKSTDITKFTGIRTVKGGAVKDGAYLGKSVRWYYAKGTEGEIIYASSGNKVPKSDGAKPLMELPDTFPTDVDYEWYIREAESILVDIGAVLPNPN